MAAPAAHASSQVYNPCERLSRGQTKFSSFGANRVTFATSSDRNSDLVTITGCVRSGNAYVKEWQDWGYSGINGFAAQNHEWESTGRSPTGSFSFTEAFGRANPGTALQYHTINYWSRWGGERGPNYNQYFEGAGGPIDENLWDNMNLGYYEQAAVINYNRQPDSPVVQGASFAIFFHAGRVPSLGCISTSLSTVTRLLQSSRPGDRIIMGSVDDVFTPYSSNPLGGITAKYAEVGGPASGLGNPTGNETGGIRDGGSYQNFQGGAIVWSPNSGSQLSVGETRGAWAASGFENGPLGFPTSGEVPIRNGGVYQNYQGGAILWSPTTGAHISAGAIRDKWAKTGFENGPLGYPTSDQIAIRDGGLYQNYQGGAIIWTPSTGAHVSSGPTRAAWQRQGFENGSLGYPSTDNYSTPGGSLTQDYQGGSITWNQSAGAYAVTGPIAAEYKDNRGLGYATSRPTGIKDGGLYQNFSNGAILWTTTTGAHLSVGATRRSYGAQGFETGPLGYPTSDEIPGARGGVAQNYQGGLILWSPTTGAFNVTGNLAVKFTEAGGLSILGYPTGPAVGIKDQGRYQNFQNGALLYSPATGVHVSSGATRLAWASTGFENGSLGYPTSDNYAGPNGAVVQDYQGGRITVLPDGTAKVSDGPLQPALPR